MTKSRNIGRGGKNKRELSGKRFGRLLVLYDNGRKDRKVIWACKCDCGNIVNIKSQRLTSGITTSCGCFHNEYISKKMWRGYKDISLTFWSSILSAAKKRNYDINISIEYAWKLYLKQKKKCALSGIEIKFSRSFTREGRKEHTCSLDRIDSSQGYIKGNVQWVHKDINKMKSDFNVEYFKDMCALIAKNTRLGD